MDLARMRVDGSDLDRMTESLFFEGMKRRTKTSQFWVLLALAGIIATLGVMQDSTATVIGAMIVAPLMTPIIGTALAFVLTDRAMLTRSITLWVVGALLVVAIGFFFGWIDWAFTTEGNSQVASRVSPSLIDLVAALATGLVGAFALVRADVSDTLPGVAIAIALVPPLGVCGLVLQEGNYAEAFGALVLFSTNVSAIIFTGTLLLLLYRVRDVAQQKGRRLEKLTGGSLFVVIGMVLVVAIPLGFGTSRVVAEQQITFTATPIAQQWAEEQDWDITQISAENKTLRIIALGRPPEIDPSALRERLDEAGLADVDMQVSLVLGGSIDYPALNN